MEHEPTKRTGGLAALLAGLLIAGSAVGVMFWQLSQKEKPVAVKIGLDSVAPGQAQSAAPLAEPQSGLDLVNPGDFPGSAAPAPVPGQQAAVPVAPPPAPAAGGAAVSAFTEAVRKSEAKARDLAIQYTQRYPAIHQYGRDWMHYPDLKKLNDDYMKDHDPVKFLRGLAGSKNFVELGAKYAADPAVRAFVKDALKQAPRDVLAASSDLLVEDGLLRALVADAGKALGLPQDFTDGLANYGKAQPAAGQAKPGQ
ncbi:MAG: hypothetical protein NTY77_18755 [Elusimicrobia bacterium]|nr:hypothetical protein [Elusimicrobiota bacterium]